jgi:hypothetical protein
MHDDGFVAPDRFRDENEVAEVQAAVARLLVSPPAWACSRPHNTLVPLRSRLSS